MCRHLGWLGDPRSVAALVCEPPSGLLVQSYAPRRQKHGLMNADGWGVGFFDGDVARRRHPSRPQHRLNLRACASLMAIPRAGRGLRT